MTFEFHWHSMIEKVGIVVNLRSMNAPTATCIRPSDVLTPKIIHEYRSEFSND